MYNIGSMYEAMVDAIVEARADGKATRWMAAGAWWLARQQILGAAPYWSALAAKITSVLPEAERNELVAQLSRQEEALVDAAGDWPDIPDHVAAFVSANTPPEPDLAALKVDAVRRIDRAAEKYRLNFITGGSGQVMAYQQKLAEARAFADDPDIAAADIPHLVAEAAADDVTVADKAVEIVATFGAWQTVSAGIEGKRMAAKKAVAAAETPAGITAAASVVWTEA